jgi:hypothetical protein
VQPAVAGRVTRAADLAQVGQQRQQVLEPLDAADALGVELVGRRVHARHSMRSRSK